MKRYLIIGLMTLLLAGMISAADCEVTAKNTDQLLEKVPEFNSMLSECPIEIPSPIDKLFGNDVVNVQIVRKDGSKDNILIETEKGFVKSIEIGYSEDPDYVATIADCALDNALASENPAGALAYLYSQKHLTIGPRGFIKSIKFRFAMFFAKGSIKSIGVETETTCGKNKVGEVCNHGGECETGNCIYVGGEGADRTYKCSCDAFKYDPYVDSNGECPGEITYPEDGSGKPGDICQHGGQCETGNCIYESGEGAGRIYKCSCNPYKLDTSSC